MVKSRQIDSLKSKARIAPFFLETEIRSSSSHLSIYIYYASKVTAPSCSRPKRSTGAK